MSSSRNYPGYDISRGKLISRVSAMLRGGSPCNPALLWQLAPYLTSDETVRLNEEAKTRRVVFAGPPFAVHGAYPIYAVTPRRSENSGVISRMVVTYEFSYRRPESYAKSPARATMATVRAPVDVEQLERAEDFACRNWDASLVWDEWATPLVGNVLTPIQNGVENRQVVCGLVRGWPEVLVGHRPEVDMIDMATDVTHCWAPICNEIIGHHTSYPSAVWCGYCGGGVNAGECTFCGARIYVAPSARSSGGYYRGPITNMAVHALRNLRDYQFPIDPLEAVKAVYREWAKPNINTLRPPLDDDHLGKEARVIKLKEEDAS